MKRIWRCIACKRTFDLAVIVPSLGPLTDEELALVPEGKWHVCPGEPINLFEEDRSRVAKTDYDWKTHPK